MLEEDAPLGNSEDENDPQEARLADVLDRHLEAYANGLSDEPRDAPPEIQDLGPALKLLLRLGDKGTSVGTAGSAIRSRRRPPRRFGDIEIIKTIDEGGQGIVAVARQLSLDRLVAIKFLRPEALDNPSIRRRFDKEVLAAAQLEHPNIVRVYSADSVDGWPYLVMEYVRGVNLEERLRKRPLDTRGRKWVDAFAELAYGLEHAHKKKIIHRDVKPANLMCDAEGRLRLIDFGLAWLQGTEELKETNAQAGSLPYMSPEQVNGHHRSFSAAVDVYGVGATLYQVLTNRPPFTAGSVGELRRKIVHEPVKPPSHLSESVPEDLDNIVQKCLAKHPRSRYPSAGALAEDLRKYAASEVVTAKPPTRLDEVLWRVRISKRGLLELAASILTVITAGLVISVVHREAKEKACESLVREATLNLSTRSLWSTAGRLALLNEQRVEEPDPGYKDGFKDPFQGGLPVIGRIRTTARSAVPAEAIIEQSLKTAVRQLTEAIDLNTGKAAPYFLLGRAHLFLGEYEASERALREALSLDPSHAPAMALLRANGTPAPPAPEASEATVQAWVDVFRAERDEDWQAAAVAYAQLEGEHGEASFATSPTLAATQQSLDFRLGHGTASLKARDLLHAHDDIFALAEAYAGDPESRLLLAASEMQEGFEQKAKQDLQLAYRAAQTGADRDRCALWACVVFLEAGKLSDAWAWANEMSRTQSSLSILAGIELQQDHRKAAEELARESLKAAEKNPAADKASASLFLADVLRFVGKTTEAMQLCEKAADLARGDARPLRRATALVHAAAAARDAGDVEQARGLLAEAREADPRSGEAYALLGELLADEGDLTRAEDAFNAALALDPGQGLVRNNLGLVLDAAGRLDEAVAQFSRAVLQAPGVYAVHLNFAWALQRQTRYGEATREYKIACALEPEKKKSSVLWTNLAACQFYVGDSPDEIYTSCVEAWKRNRHNAQAMHTLGTTLEHHNLYERAQPWLSRAASLAPDWPNALSDCGYAFQKLGRQPEADRLYESVFRFDADYPFVWAHNNWAAVRLHTRMPIPEVDVLKEVLPRLEDASFLVDAAEQLPLLTELYRNSLKDLLITMASVDALFDEPRPLVDEGVEWMLYKEISGPLEGLEWTKPEFPDGDWKKLRGPFTVPDDHRGGTVLSDMIKAYSGICLRRDVQVLEPGRIKEAFLQVRTADAFTVYWNGQVLSPEKPRPVSPAAAAPDSTNEPPEFWQCDKVPLRLAQILGGRNVLAVRGYRDTPPLGTFCLGVTLKVREVEDEARLEGLRERLQALNEVARDEDLAVVRYFEGRLQAVEGDEAAAEATLASAGALRPERPEPPLRLAALLRKQERASEAEAVLYEALAAGLGRYDRLWEAWLRTCFADLGWTPEDVLDQLSAVERPKGVSFISGDLSSHLPWLLETLRDGRAVRINCGGASYRAAEGRVFGEDCFFRGGAKKYLGHPRNRREAGAFQIPAISETYREFSADAPLVQGYAIPLPTGTYVVALRFIEVPTTAVRSFKVLVEGERRPVELPLKENSQQQLADISVHVEDAFLNIDFAVDAGNPVLSAIEIERTE